MLPKPSIAAQLMSQVGMGRPGGMASRMAPKIKPDRGSNFTAMTNALLKARRPNIKKLAPKAGKQFNTQLAGEK